MRNVVNRVLRQRNPGFPVHFLLLELQTVHAACRVVPVKAKLVLAVLAVLPELLDLFMHQPEPVIVLPEVLILLVGNPEYLIANLLRTDQLDVLLCFFKFYLS